VLRQRGRAIPARLASPAGTTIEQAITLSGLAGAIPDVDVAALETGIYAKKKPRDTVLREHDRIELYRPLIADPKHARRRRKTPRLIDAAVQCCKRLCSDGPSALEDVHLRYTHLQCPPREHDECPSPACDCQLCSSAPALAGSVCPPVTRVGLSDLGYTSYREQGRIAGISVDIANEMSRRTGCKFEFSWYPAPAPVRRAGRREYRYDHGALRLPERDAHARYLPYAYLQYDLVLAVPPSRSYASLASLSSRARAAQRHARHRLRCGDRDTTGAAGCCRPAGSGE
jgi:putative ubiquitin-RnfH superfamily antitoxin RatB of RatAB toxin-antitoxin module